MGNWPIIIDFEIICRIAKCINIMIICIWDNMFIPHSLLDKIYIVTCTVQRENATLLVIYADCTTSYKCNYHRITTTCCSSFKIFIVLIICKTMCVLSDTITAHHSWTARFIPAFFGAAPVTIFIVVCDVFICVVCFHSLPCT